MKKVVVSLVVIVISLHNLAFPQIEIVQPVFQNDENKITELFKTLSLALKYKNQMVLDQLILKNKSHGIHISIDNEEKLFDSITEVNDIQFNVSKILVQKNYYARLDFNIFLETQNDKKIFPYSLNLIKRDDLWVFQDDKQTIQLVEWIKSLKTQNLKSSTIIESFNLRFSNSALIQAKYSSNPLIWEINKSVINNQFSVDLFANGAELDGEIYWYGNNWPNDVAIFVLDPVWQRIVYSDRSSNEIRSYGDNPTDYQFSYPLGITVDDDGYIYIADTGNKRIVKLFYNSSTKQINFITTFSIPNLNAPRDIVFRRGAYQTPDQLCILDGPGGPVLITDKSGQILHVLDKYSLWGNIYNFNNPTRLVISQGGLCLLDPSSKQLLIGYPDGTNPNILHVYRKAEFPHSSLLTDVGTNCYGELIITDSYYNSLHKLDHDLNYICSFNYSSYNNPGFQYPQRFSYGKNKPGWYILEGFMADRWSSSHGIKRYLPGSDVFDISYLQIVNSSHKFSFTTSGYSNIQIDIFQNNSVIRTFQQAYGPGKNFITFPLNELPISNNFKFRVYYKPYHDGNYGSNQQGWKYKEITFSTLIGTIISGFTQSPNPINQGSSGTVTCNLLPGYNDFTYDWAVVGGTPAGFKVSFSGSQASITYNYTGLRNNLPNGEKYSIEGPTGVSLRCSVYKGGVSDVGDYAVKVATTSHGCPFVYTWNGDTWVEDNNILPQSQDSTILGQDVTDYYQLFTKPILESSENGDKYSLAIGEFAQEKSYLDQLKLLVIDHPQESFITVDDNGQVIQFAKPAYFASAEIDSNDVYKQLAGLDGEKANAQAGESMTLRFEDAGGSEENWLVLIGQVPHAAKERFAGNILDKNKESFTSFRLRKNPSYQWVAVPQGSSSTLQVDILWKGEAEIDYTELSRKLELPFTLYTPQLLNAEHSLLGDVTRKLIHIDQDYAELNLDEMITLEFSAPPVNAGMERSFVFVSRGRYEKLEDVMLAKGKTQIEKKNNNMTTSTENINIVYEYELNQNFPNPFNPVTTLSYSVKEQGLVRMKIFNLLGQEVATLVNEEKQAGRFSVNFDASALPSGVYIYSLRVNDFVQNRKMTLLK